MSYKPYVMLSLFSMLMMSLCGCRTLEKVDSAGELAPITHIENPHAAPNYQPVTMPMPAARPAYSSPNSLWRVGAQGFFKDQRASQVGDILTVVVNFDDSVTFSSTTDLSRDSKTSTGVNNLLGFETKGKKIFPKDFNNAKLFDIESNPTHTGDGSITRKDKMVTTIAASIIQILPNGNFVVNGRQEVRANNEVRELILHGIVRPEDLTAANTIDLSKIAEARVSYGGRGVMTNMQDAPIGQQIIDAVSPF